MQITLKDKTFRKLISYRQIEAAVLKMSVRLNREYKGKYPVFICVLNGAFLFASDLVRCLTFNCDITFVKLSSYEGTKSTGKVKALIGLDEIIKNREVIILEDIVDTGITVESLYKQLRIFEPSKIKIATLLFKPAAYSKKIKIDYFAFKVPDKFLVGYGLDYDGMGRNFKDIYILKD